MHIISSWYEPSIGENYIQEFPKDEASLAPFDVIFLGDVGLSEE